MKLLVLGGTAWLGHTVTATAIAAGHEVTCLARGVDVPDGAALVRARWLVQGADGGLTGVFNVMGTPVPFLEYLDAVRVVTGHDGPVVRAPEAWLTEQGVHEWSGPRSMSLWLADRSWYGMNARSNERALAAGLALRPISETIADTVRWELARDESAHTGPVSPTETSVTFSQRLPQPPEPPH